MAKGGIREGDPGNSKKASLVIHREDSGDGSGVGSPVSNIRGLCKRERVQGRGEGAQAVVALESRGTEAEDHAKRDFGSSKGAAAIGI